MLFELASRLEKAGQSVLLFTPRTSPEFSFQQIQIDWESGDGEDHLKDGDVVIYPEVVEGNPLRAKNVVRWLLHKPGFFSGSNWLPPKKDLVFHFGERCLTEGVASAGRLWVTRPLLEVFKNNTWFRWRVVFLIRKSWKYGTRKWMPKLGFRGVDDVAEQGPHEWARFLRSTLVLVSYDTETFHSVQAAMAGSLSIVVPNSTLTRQDHYARPWMKYGVAYGLRGIPYALMTRSKVRGHLEQMMSEEDESVSRFVKLTKEHFE